MVAELISACDRTSIMRLPAYRPSLKRHARRLLGFKNDENGVTTLEFAMVATPFFMLIFMLAGFSLYFFVFNSLEKGMDQTSRLVRTGQAQNSSMTVNDFKQAICDAAGEWIRCPKVQVFVQKYADWSSVSPRACTNSDGTVAINTANGSDPISTQTGTQDQIVIVTTCYKWEFAQSIPFVKFGNMADGSFMMQTATAFRTEPYTQ
jgi:Flp pilus assembly protein TadG